MYLAVFIIWQVVGGIIAYFVCTYFERAGAKQA